MKKHPIITKLARFYVDNRLYIAVGCVMAFLIFFAIWPQPLLLSSILLLALIAHLLVIAYLEVF